jgi:hypothetical protein
MNIMLRTKNTGELNIDRVFARLFVVMGGIFWVAAAFTAGTVMKSYTEVPMTLPELQQGAMTALFPLVLIAVVFVLGWFYERLTGVMLVVVAIAMLVYGFFQHSPATEPVLWVTAFSILVLPSLIAAALYELAARRQEAQEREAAAAPAQTASAS